jgi:SOS-response transcriptional repressor LexA
MEARAVGMAEMAVAAERRRQQVLQFVRRHIEEHGYAPTLRDICAACGISSTSAASYSVRALHERGLLHRTPGISRGIALAER